MNELQRGIIHLIRACLTGQSANIPEDFDWIGACKIGGRHSIMPMLYYGARASHAAMPADVEQALRSATLKSAYVDQNQLRELSDIAARFQSAGVDFLPLKGTILKHKYPQTEVRLMSDADILIRTEQYPVIRPIMEELGYIELVESDHELVWDKKGALHLELHKRLVPSYNEDYYAYFGDGWKLAQKAEGTRYILRDEDHFIYLFTHYAKHYRAGGIGIRHLTDLYVFLQDLPDLDLAYMEGELAKLHLLDFYRNSMHTVDVWFRGEPATAISDFLTDRIFDSGSYGTKKAKTLASGAKLAAASGTERVRGRQTWLLLFPPARDMEQAYPVLKKWKILLPFLWVWRWFRVLLFKRSAIKQKKEAMELLTAENIADYQSQLDFVGLHFEFKE